MAARTSLADLLDAMSDQELEALTAEDFGFFVQVMYRATRGGEDLVWAPFLDLICARLGDVAHGRCRNLIITMPPRHLKSFCVSVCLPAFLHGHYPDHSTLCVSYSQELAKEFARDGQAVMQSEAYRALFGEVLKVGRQTLHALRTRKGGVRRATSVDGTATGLGGDLIIFDDPQKPGEALSEAMRRSTNEAYTTTFFNRGNNPNTVRRVIVMQRLHEDDFVASVLGRGGEKWEVINLPAVAEEDQATSYSTVLGDHVYRRRIGEALHPKRLALTKLNEIRDTVGEAVWATQYQQRPAPAGGGVIKIAWFKRYGEGEIPESFDRVVQSWDTASTITGRSAFSVCTTWGVKGKHIWLLHVYRARLGFPDLRRAIIAQADLHEATQVFIENESSGIGLIQQLREEGVGILRPVKPVHDKVTRMVNQTALIEAGFVHVPMEAPWLAEYLHELAVFPNCKHFDQIDSTSQALDNINKWSGGAGLLEFMRQEQEAAKAYAEDEFVLRPPPGMRLMSDIEGGRHEVQADGCFHLNRMQAGPVMNLAGWKQVRTPGR